MPCQHFRVRQTVDLSLLSTFGRKCASSSGIGRECFIRPAVPERGPPLQGHSGNRMIVIPVAPVPAVLEA